jgi:hypothetical protein
VLSNSKVSRNLSSSFLNVSNTETFLRCTKIFFWMSTLS